MTWFEDSKISLIEWPPRSPDINWIENVWKMLSDIVYDQKQFQNKKDLWLAVQDDEEVIMKTKRDVIKEWFTRFNRRLLSLIKNRGLHVPY